MKKFSLLTKRLAILFSTFTGLIVVLFIGMFVYQANPKLFGSNKEVALKDWQPKDVDAEMAAGYLAADVRYGYKVLTETQKFIGPQAKNADMRIAGNNLACTSCHLDGGNVAGAASWAGVTKRYPSFRGRSNGMGTIQDRINGCMERSMNGKKLDKESKAMRGMVAYMEWLTEDMPQEKVDEIGGFTKLEIPDKAVDFEAGKAVFFKECAECHHENGQGEKFADFTLGYQYPPLWGPDSYNDGAGMHRVLTAAQFIKANMPYGQATRDNPKLTDEEAYNVAGYINSLARPEKSNKKKDYPDLKLKPVSTPYGPWAENFSEEQHRFGPFPPIIKFYKEKYDLKKSN